LAIGDFLTGIGQGLIAPVVERQQQEAANELAFKQYQQQQEYNAQFQKQQEQQMVEGLIPALTGYAGLLQQSGRAEDAQNVLSGINALRQGGLQGLTIQQQLKPKDDKEKKPPKLGVEREAAADRFFKDAYSNLEQEDQAFVDDFVKDEKVAEKFRDPALGLRVLDTYDREPNIRAFRELKDSYNQMAQVLTGGVQRGDFAFADQAAIVMFNKVIDPTSVVREGEFARTTQFVRFTERLKGMVQKVQAGGTLTDKERQELIDTSYDLVKSAHKVSNKRKNTFILRGKRFNLLPEDFDPENEISIPEKLSIPQDKILSPEDVLKNKPGKKK